MNILGVIAEFNPLHAGHEYLIKTLRWETGADYCVAVMSGDYVQRGEPAFFAKSLRTEAALRCGVDLVLELPLSVSTGSAEYFAHGAVSLLNRLGCITHLGFGSECGDIHALKAAGQLLSEEPEAYRAFLQQFLKQGMSFPKARMKSLLTYYGDEETVSLLDSPNNILGAEYCKALHLLNSPIVPVTIQRMGAGYREESIGASYASASGLRKAFGFCAATERNRAVSEINWSVSGEIENLLQGYVPKGCRPLYLDALQKRRHVTFDDFFLPLCHALQFSDAETLCRYQDVTPEFAERLLRLFRQASSITELCALLKAKNMTSTRVNRCLLHILLHLAKDDVAAEKEQGFALYARILGFRGEAEPLFSLLKKTADIPLVSKMADAQKTLSPLALSQLSRTAKASELYRAAMRGGLSGSEYAERIVIV